MCEFWETRLNLTSKLLKNAYSLHKVDFPKDFHDCEKSVVLCCCESLELFN